MDERIVIHQNRLYFVLAKSLVRYFGEKSDLRVAVTGGHVQMVFAKDMERGEQQGKITADPFVTQFRNGRGSANREIYQQKL
jgi:hypothetical protein